MKKECTKEIRLRKLTYRNWDALAEASMVSFFFITVATMVVAIGVENPTEIARFTLLVCGIILVACMIFVELSKKTEWISE